MKTRQIQVFKSNVVVVLVHYIHVISLKKKPASEVLREYLYHLNGSSGETLRN